MTPSQCTSQPNISIKFDARTTKMLEYINLLVDHSILQGSMNEVSLNNTSFQNTAPNMYLLHSAPDSACTSVNYTSIPQNTKS